MVKNLKYCLECEKVLYTDNTHCEDCDVVLKKLQGFIYGEGDNKFVEIKE